eukprot:2381569-Rhodomonas_salina.1
MQSACRSRPARLHAVVLRVFRTLQEVTASVNNVLKAGGSVLPAMVHYNVQSTLLLHLGPQVLPIVPAGQGMSAVPM